MYIYIYRIISILFIAICLLFPSSTKALAQVILASETFEDGSDDGWVKVHEQGTDLSSQWHIVNGMYGLQIPVGSTVENNYFGDESWSDYQVSFDMKAISGKDKNFVFRYQSYKGGTDYEKGYEFHISGTTFNLKKIGYGNIAPTQATDIQNGQLINWKITVIGTKITAEYKKQTEAEYKKVLDINDTTPNPTLNGKIGLRIGTGADFPCEVYYDNIVVTDLSDKRILLNVPFLSQKDPLWANTIYDSADKWATSSAQGIKDWGCAMTSAAMILNYHGITKDASGSATTPETLNQYLNDNNGYSQKGHLNWPSIAEYAIKSIESGKLTATARPFDFLYQAYTKDRVINDLSIEWPSVLRIVTNSHSADTVKDDDTHFVVAKGYDPTQNIYLADPLLLSDDNPNLEEAYAGKQYSKVGRFLPYTDLAYLWIYVHNDSNYAWIEQHIKKLGTKDGTEYREIENAEFALEGVSGGTSSANLNPSWMFSIPKPQNGEYTLHITSPSLSITPIELFVYDKNAKHKKLTKNILVSPNSTRVVDITYNSDDVNASTISVRSTYSSLKDSIRYANTKGWLHSTLKRHLLALIELSEKLSNRYHKSSQMILKVVDRHLDIMYRMRKISKTGYQLILSELTPLIRK